MQPTQLIQPFPQSAGYFRDLLTHSSGIDYSDIGSEPMKSIYAKAGIPSGLGYFDKDLLTENEKNGQTSSWLSTWRKISIRAQQRSACCLIQVISGKNA